MHGQDQNRPLGMLALQLFEEIEAIDIRKRQIQQHQIAVEIREPMQRLVAGGRFVDDRDVVGGRHDLPNPLTNHRMIVGDEDANHYTSSLGDTRRSANGMETTTMVPRGRPACTSIDPSSSAARSRMPSSPSESR